ncbi:MAG: serine hydrolase domain-containing protein [Ilumatobacteraceae bacterium]
MAEISGQVDERFVGLRDQLASSLDSGADVGASVAMTIDGELVVDLWGGYADEAKTQPWQQDTITNVWSTTKTMMFLVCLTLIERGELDPDRPVADYWPEFAANGKAEVTVAHLMSHSSGLSGWEEPITLADLEDFEKCSSLLAAQAPWWPPGTASGYHALNQGYLLGEVVRRITGVTLGSYFASEIAGPIGADFHIGTGPEHFDRISNVIPPPPLDPASFADNPPPMALKTLVNPMIDASHVWTAGWRQAEIGAANGHGNARSVALLQSIVANGGTSQGLQLLSEATIDRIFQERTNGVDLVLGIQQRFGLGYGLLGDEFPPLAGSRVCFWGGYGGSIIFVDVDRRVTFAYMMNKMQQGTI